MGEIPLFIRVGKHFETICFSQIECCWIHKIKVIWPTRRNFVISLTLVVYRFCNGSPRPAEARQSAHRASILSSEITKDKASVREVGIYLCWPASTCLCIGSQTRTLQPYAYLWRWKFSFLVCVCILYTDRLLSPLSTVVSFALNGHPFSQRHLPPSHK